MVFISPETSLHGVNASATIENFKQAIDWTRERSDSDDLIFIFIVGHGGGYNTRKGLMEGGRIDGSGNDTKDEGLEHLIDGNWEGVDECIRFGSELYYDDELATDLNTLTYSKLVFVRVGCAENDTGEGCFNGGLIDDISAPNRIIITASNETYYCVADWDGNGLSEWSEAFINALHAEDFDTGAPVDADIDNDGKLSMWEAWTYAWDNDIARLSGAETPWYDDDGDGLPTFINGSDHLDEDGQGDLAKHTYLVAVPQPACAMKTRTNGDFYVPNITISLLKVEMLFDDSGMEGDQTGNSSSPYKTISHYPDGVVDGVDYQFVKRRIGQTEGSASWDYMADVRPDWRLIDGQDWQIVKNNVGRYGSYITDLSGVTITFDTGEVLEPENGYVTIPQNAANFTVCKNGNLIGAMIIFW